MASLMQTTGSGWRRIGVVVSVIWFIGFSGYYYYAGKEAILKEEMSKEVISKGGMSKEKISDSIDSQLKYCVTHSNGEAEFDNCADSVRRNLREMRSSFQRMNDNIQRINYNILHKEDEFTASIPLFVAFNFATIICGWLLGWFGIVTARWIRRGFA
jgi:hypothetical protein